MSLMIGCKRQGQSSEEGGVEMAGSDHMGAHDSLDGLPPTVASEPIYSVLNDPDITYASGLAHDQNSAEAFPIQLKLDVYYPEAAPADRPVFMFIHGGGFTGGTKTKPEIVDMANYYASRGWVFASIDYRTTEELCDSERARLCEEKLRDMSPEEVVSFYAGIAPQAWVELALELSENIKALQQMIAMYAAQRDAKAALRWLVSESSRYQMNTDYITVGGASAGAITTIALGISDQSDFRDELTTDQDPTLSMTHLNESYDVQTMVYFWGSNVKLELLELVYGARRYDADDPELFMAHGTDDRNPTTAFTEATELQELYDGLNIHNELVPLEGQDHGAWSAEVNGKGLFQLTFDFLVDRQGLDLQ